jgi:hypothetical protein
VSQELILVSSQISEGVRRPLCFGFVNLCWFQSKIRVCLVAAISIFPIPVVFVLRNFYLSHVHPDLRFYFSLLIFESCSLLHEQCTRSSFWVGWPLSPEPQNWFPLELLWLTTKSFLLSQFSWEFSCAARFTCCILLGPLVVANSSLSPWFLNLQLLRAGVNPSSACSAGLFLLLCSFPVCEWVFFHASRSRARLGSVPMCCFVSVANLPLTGFWLSHLGSWFCRKFFRRLGLCSLHCPGL